MDMDHGYESSDEENDNDNENTPSQSADVLTNGATSHRFNERNEDEDEDEEGMVLDSEEVVVSGTHWFFKQIHIIEQEDQDCVVSVTTGEMMGVCYMKSLVDVPWTWLCKSIFLIRRSYVLVDKARYIGLSTGVFHWWSFGVHATIWHTRHSSL